MPRSAVSPLQRIYLHSGLQSFVEASRGIFIAGFLVSRGFSYPVALASFALTPPSNSDANIPLSISVSTTDAGVVTTSAPVTHLITVSAVADAPNLSGAASGLEDTAFAFPITT